LDILRHYLHASSHGVPVSPPSLPHSLARRSQLYPTLKHNHPTRPNHYTSTFSFENPQGVDNCDNPIESSIPTTGQIFPLAT
jgi:hypothetical protein